MKVYCMLKGRKKCPVKVVNQKDCSNCFWAWTKAQMKIKKQPK